jgi:hypothetical protein
MLYTYFVWLVMLGSSVVATLILVAAAVTYPNGYPDPFAPYEELRPGQSTEVLEKFDCRVMDSDYGPPNSRCAITPNDNIFERIEVISWDERLRYVVFYGETLQVVDLVRRWGKPDVITQIGFRFNLRWRGEIVAVAPMAAPRFNHQLPVQSVIIRWTGEDS